MFVKTDWIKFKRGTAVEFIFCLTFIVLLFSAQGCRKKQEVRTSFYYWKTGFKLDSAQKVLVRNVAKNRLYVRLFDVVWNEQLNVAIPNAMIAAEHDLKAFQICPVIYLTNKTFEHTKGKAVHGLAYRVHLLITKLAAKHQFTYTQIQLDCDWTGSTRESYFEFLKALKKYSGKQLEATIRLHQVKYPERTGVPPVDRGVLMFYNMGKISADLRGRNSIYNKADADKYVNHLAHYTLPLDVALPTFSWAIHIRGGHVIQIYGKLGLKKLSNTTHFKPLSAVVYRAVKSFFLQGIYIKSGDIFKFEDIKPADLNQAADQLTAYLVPLNNRSIIFYELSSNNIAAFGEEDILKVSDRFK